jgi:hypothetical protein
MRRRGPEAAVLVTVKAAAEARGCLVLRANAGLTVLAGPDGRRRAIQGAAPGCSDLILAVPPAGRFLALEIKAPSVPGVRRDGAPSAAQLAFLDRVAAAGGVGAVVWSAAQAEAVLDRLGCPGLGETPR